MKLKRHFWKELLPPLLPLVLIIFCLEILVRFEIIRSFLVPPPSQIARCFFTDADELWAAFLETSACAVTGLVLSFLIGTITAILLSLSRFLRRAIYPYATFFQTVPIVAVAPLLVIWFGFGRPTVVASALIVSIFPVIASTLLGLRSTDPMLSDLFRLYSASKIDQLVRLKIPYALPQIFSGLRIASGLAVIGAIVGEFIAGGGLGSVVDAARTQQRIDKVFAAVLISAFLGLLMTGVIDQLSQWMLRNWHASAQDLDFEFRGEQE